MQFHSIFVLLFFDLLWLANNAQASPIKYEFEASVTEMNEIGFFSAVTGLDYNDLNIGDMVYGYVTVDWDQTSSDPGLTGEILETQQLDQSGAYYHLPSWLIMSLHDSNGNTWSPQPENYTSGDVVQYSKTEIDYRTVINHTSNVSGAWKQIYLHIYDGNETLAETFNQIELLDLDAAFGAWGSASVLYSPDFNVKFDLTTLQLATVPAPAAVWLFGSGILGLIAVSRRQRLT